MRLLFPVLAVACAIAGAPAWAQDEAAPRPAAPAMKCDMGAMKDGSAHDVVGKLTAKKKDLKLNDKQIQQIAAALAAAPAHDMAGMACCDHGAAAEK